MALKLPTLLEGEALVAWLGISAKIRTNYSATKQALTNALKPTEFTAFAEFQSRTQGKNALWNHYVIEQ